MGRWHSDVDDRDVRHVLADRLPGVQVASPAWPTTSIPASVSERAIPSRSRTESSARTTRRVTPEAPRPGSRARQLVLGHELRTWLLVEPRAALARLAARGQHDERRRSGRPRALGRPRSPRRRAGRCRAGRDLAGASARPRGRTCRRQPRRSQRSRRPRGVARAWTAERGMVVDDEDRSHGPIIRPDPVEADRVNPESKGRSNDHVATRAVIRSTPCVGAASGSGPRSVSLLRAD